MDFALVLLLNEHIIDLAVAMVRHQGPLSFMPILGPPRYSLRPMVFLGKPFAGYMHEDL